MIQIILGVLLTIAGVVSGLAALMLNALRQRGTPLQFPHWLPALLTLIAIAGIGCGIGISLS